MSSKSERQAAQELVRAYHQARLTELVERVGRAMDQFRAGELTTFETDRVLFHYHRAADELWRFCNQSDIVFTAHVITERNPDDWWDKGAPRQR